MMCEEDDVFLSDTDNSNIPQESKYSRVYGRDDITTRRHGNKSLGCRQNEALHPKLKASQFDNFDVVINDPKLKRLPRKKLSNRSESSEDDVTDEHFGNGGATKPLMHPRQRPKTQLTPRQRRLRKCCSSLLYLLLVVGGLSSLAFLVVHVMKNYADGWLDIKKAPSWRNQTVVGCTSVSLERVWVKGIPKMMTESSFRLVDVNQDGVLDILFGFATGAEGYNVPSLVCDIYFNGTHPCLGGLLALDGRTGNEIWRHYSEHEIFAVNCRRDLDNDGIKDCLISGRVGGFEAVSGKDGHMLWNFTHAARISAMNVYTAQFVRDLNGDGVPDILNIHGGDPFGEPGSATRLTGRIFLFSGVDGHVLQWVDVPDGRESYYSPVLYTRRDGTEVVLFGTGGETHPGSLWYIALDDLYRGDIHKARQIIHNQYKGFMTPPVLLDLTRDGVPDLVFASYNSTVLAYDGETYELLWNFSYPMSETYATPAPGYYNDDDVPDFMVHWQYGPGFPVYYHSITTILDGRDGTPILKPYIKSSVGAQSSPLTISVEGLGNDVFLYWYADCLGHEGQGGRFQFVEGTNVHEESRSDVCRLRFKSEGFSKLFALSRHLQPPGVEVYYSENNGDVEHSAWVNATVEAVDFLKRHPEYIENYNVWREWVIKNIVEKEGLSYYKTQSISAPEDLREHLRQSLAVITGQLKKPAKLDNLNNQHSSDHTLANQQSAQQYPANQRTPDQVPATTWLTASASSNEKLPTLLKGILAGDYADGSSAADDDGVWPVSLDDSDGATNDNSNYKYLRLIYESLNGKNSEVDDYLRRFMDETRTVPGEQWRLGRKRTAKQRSRRHVGPHDEGGLQRLISTGSLAPPLLPVDDPDYEHSIDIVFATYWFYPAKTEAILPEDQRCIDEKMKAQLDRFDPNSKYFGMDDDGYAHAVTEECLKKSNHQLSNKGIYNNQHTYNPYNIHMGQLTVYRMRLKCHCGKLTRNQRCSRIIPFNSQQWSGYMGSDATSHWLPLASGKHTLNTPPGHGS